MVVPQEGQDWDDALRVDEDLQLLIPCHLNLLHILWKHLLDIAAKVQQLRDALFLVRLYHCTNKDLPIEEKEIHHYYLGNNVHTERRLLYVKTRHLKKATLKLAPQVARENMGTGIQLTVRAAFARATSTGVMEYMLPPHAHQSRGNC